MGAAAAVCLLSLGCPCDGWTPVAADAKCAWGSVGDLSGRAAPQTAIRRTAQFAVPLLTDYCVLTDPGLIDVCHNAEIIVDHVRTDDRQRHVAMIESINHRTFFAPSVRVRLTILTYINLDNFLFRRVRTPVSIYRPGHRNSELGNSHPQT